MTEWKTRFYYTWDWVPRLVQIGVWDKITIEVCEGADIHSMMCQARVNPRSWEGNLHISGKVSGEANYLVHVSLHHNTQLIKKTTMSLDEFNQKGMFWQELNVELWYPNGLGPQPLYEVSLAVIDQYGNVYDEQFP